MKHISVCWLTSRLRWEFVAPFIFFPGNVLGELWGCIAVVDTIMSLRARVYRPIVIKSNIVLPGLLGCRRAHKSRTGLMERIWMAKYTRFGQQKQKVEIRCIPRNSEVSLQQRVWLEMVIRDTNRYNWRDSRASLISMDKWDNIEFNEMERQLPETKINKHHATFKRDGWELTRWPCLIYNFVVWIQICHTRCYGIFIRVAMREASVWMR